MSEHLQRALVLLEVGRAAQAEEELRRELSQCPDNFMAHRMLAWCLSVQDRYSEARLEAEEAIRLNPDADDAHRVLGWTLSKLRRWEEAEKALREAIRLNPQDSLHYDALASLFGEQLRWTECAESAREGLRLDPDNMDCANLLIQALFQLDCPEEAQNILNMVKGKDPENAWTQFNLGLLYQHKRNPKKALHHFRESARIDPSSHTARKWIKRVQDQLQKRPIAWVSFLPILFTLIYFFLKLMMFLMSN